MPTYLTGAVEGLVDEAVFRRLVRHVGLEVVTVFRTDGKEGLLRRLPGFNRSARHKPWLVLVDLDRDASCAPTFRDRHLPSPSQHMEFRVAVRAIEAWILADAERVREWLSAPRASLPTAPDDLPDPKEALVAVAKASSSRVAAELVPRAGSGRRVGSLYTSHVIGFVGQEATGWRPGAAARRSDSLARCIRSLARFRS